MQHTAPEEPLRQHRTPRLKRVHTSSDQWHCVVIVCKYYLHGPPLYRCNSRVYGLECVHKESISRPTWVFHYYSPGNDTARPVGLHAWLRYACTWPGPPACRAGYIFCCSFLFVFILTVSLEIYYLKKYKTDLTKFSGLIDIIWMQMIDLTFVLRSLKWRCHGTQFCAKLAKLAYLYSSPEQNQQGIFPVSSAYSDFLNTFYNSIGRPKFLWK